MVIRYPDYVKMILNRIENAGYEAFIVGGAVRDSLLGREVNDYDVTTSALPMETAELFSDIQVILTGLKHGTVTVVAEGHPTEITTYRVDGGYTDSRHPLEVSFTPKLEEDLARRDFTVNAMAYNGERGLVDIFGGQRDIELGLVRAVGDPELRFTEDALRIMRAFRFASKLGFEIEENTLDAAVRCKKGLENISVERKTAELEGIVLGPSVKKILCTMNEVGIFEVISGGIKLDATRIDKLSSLPLDFACRMAFCLLGQEEAERYISSMRLSNAVSGKIRKLISLAERQIDLKSEADVRRLVASAKDCLEEFFSIKKALGEKVDDAVKKAEEIIARGDCTDLKSLALGGSDLVALGISGKDVGKLLGQLLESVLDDPSLNNRTDLLQILRNIEK